MPEIPRLTPEKRREQAKREARLAQALRDNLRRRKDQARAREPDPDAPLPEPADGDEPPN